MSKRIEARELGQLLDEYASPLAIYASQWTTCPEDCVQEAMVELAALANRPDNPVAWLFRVVRNRSLNQLRSRRRRTKREQEAARPDAHQLDPSSKSQSEDEQRRLRRVLDELANEDRELVMLRIWSGMGWREIGELTGTSSSTAQRRYVAALEKMKQLLETPCPTKPE